MRRALIVKLGAIGDVVMAIPAVYQLHLQGYEVDWVCGTAVASLLRCYSWIHPLPLDDAALLHGSPVQRLRAVATLWTILLRTHYDLAATLYYDSRWRLLMLPVRASRTLSLSHSDRARRILPGRHHTSEFARILLGLPDTCREAALLPVCPDTLPPSPLLPPIAARIALVPAGASNTQRQQTLRRWPGSAYARVAQTLLERGCEVVLLGGPGDSWVREHFVPLGSQPGLFDCIGTTTLPELVSIAGTCDLVVSHDTGPLHVAALSSAPILALFGPTDPGSFLPRRARVLWGGETLSCRPCYDGRDFPPCLNNGCMQSIAVDAVLQAIDAMVPTTRFTCEPCR